ncbi:MAG TPA: hypothetical protein PK736_02325 [Bacteroidia bacterium]|nr:hypothetical protein [Bacteroidia bacterium]
MKYTQNFLKKVEDQLNESGYQVRYEKGNFKSGYCVLETKKVVVVNKFVTLENKINTLVEILNLLGNQSMENNAMLNNSENADNTEDTSLEKSEMQSAN